MRVILGQGNPGKEYQWTRHNLGYIAVDLLAKIWDINWQKAGKFNAEIADYPEKNLILVKSGGFYNETGLSAAKIVNFYKIDPSKDFLAICDDLNLPFGDIRLRESGSAGGNNGLKSLISSLKTDAFPRLRIGTSSELRGRTDDTDFVLGKLTPEERKELPKIMKTVTEKVQDWLNP